MVVVGKFLPECQNRFFSCDTTTTVTKMIRSVPKKNFYNRWFVTLTRKKTKIFVLKKIDRGEFDNLID